MQVLVVDDDAVTRLILERTVEGLGHEVISVEDAQAALDTSASIHFPVIITDWLMPGMDGGALCRAIRARTEREYSYIIVITSLEGRAPYLEAMDAGADDFLVKPVDAGMVAARIKVAERVLKLDHEVKQLELLLPICAYCKNIRTSDDTWVRVESYLAKQNAAELTHGICPSCQTKYFGGASGPS